jgi:hypothetical protein
MEEENSWKNTCRHTTLTLRDGTVHKAKFKFNSKFGRAASPLSTPPKRDVHEVWSTD